MLAEPDLGSVPEPQPLSFQPYTIASPNFGIDLGEGDGGQNVIHTREAVTIRLIILNSEHILKKKSLWTLKTSCRETAHL